MDIPQIRLKVEGFRAISKADIIIDGITVVAGENGSGKSTLSKLLYYVFKTACNYDDLVEQELMGKMEPVVHFFNVVIADLVGFSHGNVMRANLRNELRSLRDAPGLLSTERMKHWELFVRSISNSFIEFIGKEQKREILSQRQQRLKYMLQDLLKTEEENVQLSPKSFDGVNELINSYYRDALSKIESRPSDLFDEAIYRAFISKMSPKAFEVHEAEGLVIAKGRKNISRPYSIRNTIYSDTPMSIGINGSGNEHWDDLNNLLVKKGMGNSSDLASEIKRIIKGDVSVEDSPFALSNFVFNRDDGNAYNLIECATGIRSFAILQLLYNNGSLNDKTLFIIDEPEVHLHPQWIVEYARIVVMLNKQLGVKFFIASHDPDFVSAVRYISEKEGNLDKVNYYLAEKVNGGYAYDYRYLGSEIDPIFKSFNIAIDRINEYGV